jgi:hypothetical protein
MVKPRLIAGIGIMYATSQARESIDIGVVASNLVEPSKAAWVNA